MRPTHPSLRCLVTGASRGIGAAIVAELDGLGHRIALNARSQVDLERVAAGLSVDSLILPADVTAPTAAQSMRAAVQDRWGGIDVLVVNAGEGVSAPLARTDDAAWEHSLELNLTAPFRLLRAFVPDMVAQGFGRVVVIASVAAKVGKPYVSAYTAAKHGVLGLTRSVAAEVAGTGVTVNAICPGYVDTPMTEQSIDTIMVKTGRSREEARGVLERQQPIGRLITVDEVSRAVAFCIEDTGALNGQAVTIDGGGVQS